MKIPRVYSLGLTDVNKFLVYNLAKYPEQPKIPDIVLLLKSDEQLSRFVSNDSKVSVTDYTNLRASTKFTQLMAAYQPPRFANGDHAPIENLTISSSSFQLKTELKKFQKSINQNSNILLLNPSMSATQTINQLYGNSPKKPNIYQCLSTHSLWGAGEFGVNNIGRGNLTITKVPKNSNAPISEQNNLIDMKNEPPFIQLLSKLREVDPVFVSYFNFQLLQMESLVIKACIEPLTDVFDCYNGDLLKMDKISEISGDLIDESCQILKIAHPELVDSPLGSIALNSERLLDVVFNNLNLNKEGGREIAKLQKRSKKQEIFETNGYLSSLAKKHKIKAPLNTTYSDILRAKYSLANNRGLNGRL
ncbi:Glycerol-3-phosphate dehydrogenase [NAD(P)+] [Wickerhamomyces ciferrii]|uniref:Glycerol-3-phosphate dehydrogenase [NAD(P)+] n=1 Tax=Wickerhamomyces ciferrii (strain ATCC 14091 / BCRC 22168 / CBS 111 / JCM 3599 / NBRC 0793 / NRRL Y-1031 F-60-10) TaxID=1206466 RepID=K0KJF7_WICCF|nr:Glycerol-3-phosphate dehydrogenase [NAD(P)+] [Wickerhamomyces ciferrii]CCH41619.1 Glycerol-3-phosphate dehydrogenase [NAD(P)+] [Wickerhamomyces ciferrii]